MHISFRATLLSLMMAVLLTAVALLGTAAYLYGRFTVQDLGTQILTQASERVEQHVQHVLDAAEDEAETVASLISGGWLNPDNHQQVTDYFLASLKARPSLSYLSFGMPSGKYYHAFRDRSGELSALWLLPNSDGSRRLFEFRLRPDGSRETIRDIRNSTRTPPYDRPYYLVARKAGKALWTESYVFLGSGESLDVPGVSRAVPVNAPEDGRLLGVLTADFDLYAMSRFLRQVALGGEGLCFLVEVTSDEQLRVIAHPGAADPNPDTRLDLTEAATDGGGRVTVRADQVADSRVTRFLSSLNFPTASTLTTVVLETDSRKYLGAYRYLDRIGGPNWIICTLLPESELFGGVRRMARLMALLGAVGVLGAAVLSVILSQRIAGHLGIIARETREIGQFRLAPKRIIPSRIREISTLATAVEEMKTGLRSFQKYVPADLVRLLLESNQEAELGGARKEISVYFSDLVDFTSISERLPPDQLVAMLSRYLDEMTREILQNGGTVDKYMGDAIMAFWGAPHPHSTHALAACRSALANQTRLAQLREEWTRTGLPALRARIGLHTGEAAVGNFGSPDRLDYTAIGDTVNLTSRLERLNRIYGTEILISESTRIAVADFMATRPIDKVAVKGRSQGILVYELLGEKGSVAENVLNLTARYAEALHNYFSGNWTAAEAGFEAVLERHPEDAAARLMRDRCRMYLASPPANGWDGIFQAPK